MKCQVTSVCQSFTILLLQFCFMIIFIYYYVIAKMNKDLLAKWLMEEGVENDDIIILKCKLTLCLKIYIWKIFVAVKEHRKECSI